MTSPYFYAKVKWIPGSFFNSGLKNKQFSEITESEAQMVDTGQVYLEMVIKKCNCWSFINLCIFSCQTKNIKYYYVVISRSIFGFK